MASVNTTTTRRNREGNTDSLLASATNRQGESAYRLYWIEVGYPLLKMEQAIYMQRPVKGIAPEC